MKQFIYAGLYMHCISYIVSQYDAVSWFLFTLFSYLKQGLIFFQSTLILSFYIDPVFETQSKKL